MSGATGHSSAGLGLLVWLLLGAAAALAACSGAAANRPAEDPFADSLQRSTSTIGGALEAALEAAEEQDVVTFRARFNPTTTCPCPAWEVHLWGRWIRVYLEPAATAALDVDELSGRARERLEQGDIADWRAIGSLAEDGLVDATTGLRYPVLVVESVEQP